MPALPWLLALSPACLDYGLQLERPLWGGDDTDSTVQTREWDEPTSTTVPLGASDTANPPPEPWLDGECPDEQLARWSGGKLSLFAAYSAPEVGSFHVETAGTYHVYDIALAESGDSQTNESAFLRVPNTANPDGTPVHANCEAEWVVPDSDNDGELPAGRRQYLGTFAFDAGDNRVEFHHYCWLYLDGLCPEFHVPEPERSDCPSLDANSVHFTGEALCLVPAG